MKSVPGSHWVWGCSGTSPTSGPIEASAVALNEVRRLGDSESRLDSILAVVVDTLLTGRPIDADALLIGLERVRLDIDRTLVELAAVAR